MADDGQRKDGAAESADDAESTQFPHTEAIQRDDDELPPAPPRAAMVEVEQNSWRHNPLVWVLLVVAMFLSVPLLSECSHGTRRERAVKPAEAASVAEPAAAAQASDPPAVVEAARPPTASLATPKNVQAAPGPPADGTRQMITKCVERGRIVYTQTGECSGNVSAVPIDTDKNVVGNDKPAREGAPRTP
jgi:hypothetical protein